MIKRLFRRKPKELPEEVMQAAVRILEEHQNRAAFNASMSREAFHEAVQRGEIEYLGMTAEEICGELVSRGYDW